MIAKIETPSIVARVGYGTPSGGKFSYKRLYTKTIQSVNRIVDENDNIMTFQEIVDLYNDETVFLYLISANIILIPSFKETNAISFIGSYYIRQQANLHRVIINSQEEVNINDITLEEQVNKVDDLEEWELTEDDKYYPNANSVVKELQKKQNIISDLETIRSGASKGETALQNIPNTYKTKEENDLLYQAKGDVPTKTSELTNDSGFITNEYHDDTKQNVSTLENDVKEFINEEYIKQYTGGSNNLGKMSEHNTQDNSIDLTNLKIGEYTIEPDSGRIIWFKANYKGEMRYYSLYIDQNIYTYPNVVLSIKKQVSDDLTSGEVFAIVNAFVIQQSATSSIIGYKLYNLAFTSNNTLVKVGGSDYYVNPVNVSYNQNISGKKTFTTLPESSVTPTTNNQLVNKKYVDDTITNTLNSIETELSEV